jgi:hypothetical protein
VVNLPGAEVAVVGFYLDKARTDDMISPRHAWLLYVEKILEQ